MSINITKGIFFCLLSCFLFAVLDTSIKLLHNQVSVVQILFFRSFFTLVFFSTFAINPKKRYLIGTFRPHLHAARGIMGFFILILYFYACQNHSLASVVAISFTTPIFVTLLAIPILKEKVRIHRWSAIILGFIGTILIVNPTDMTFDMAILAAVASALIGAFNAIHLRYMVWTENSITNIFAANILWMVMTMTLLPFFWMPLSFENIAILALIGLVGGAAQFLGTESLILASPAITSTFSYTRLLWTIIFSFLIWHELPQEHVLFGSICIVTSCLYILYREIILKRKRIPSRRIF